MNYIHHGMNFKPNLSGLGFFKSIVIEANTNYTVDQLLNNIIKAKNRYYSTTKREPTHVTLHYHDVLMIKSNIEFFEPNKFTVCGLKVFNSADIRRGYCLVGEEF